MDKLRTMAALTLLIREREDQVTEASEILDEMADGIFQDPTESGNELDWANKRYEYHEGRLNLLNEILNYVSKSTPYKIPMPPAPMPPDPGVSDVQLAAIEALLNYSDYNYNYMVKEALNKETSIPLEDLTYEQAVIFVKHWNDILRPKDKEA